MGQGLGTPQTHPIRIRTAQRRAEIIRQRIAGKTVTAIAADIGITHQSVVKHLQLAIQSMKTEHLDELIKLEMQRLDELLEAVWDGAKKGDEKMVARALDVMARRAKLLGLDSPVQHQIGGRDGPPIPVRILNQQ